MDPMDTTIRPFGASSLDIAECSELMNTREFSPSGEQPESASVYVFGQKLTSPDLATRLPFQESGQSSTPSPVHGKWVRTRNISESSSASHFSNPPSIEQTTSAEIEFSMHELEAMAILDRRSSAGSSLAEFQHSAPITPPPDDLVEQPEASQEPYPKKKTMIRLDLSMANLKSLISPLQHPVSLDESTSSLLKTVAHDDIDTPFKSTTIEAITLRDYAKPTIVRRRREVLPGHTQRAFRDFLIEQKIHSGLHHSNIVKYLGCDLQEVDGKLYLDTYTAHAGENASDYFQTHRGMSPSTFIPLACQLFSALAYLASERVIHRDISPANILIKDDQVSLIDFELAYSPDHSSTASLHFMQGNLLYLAPELSRGEKATPHSDTYGAAMTLLQLMEYIEIIDRHQIRKELSRHNKRWYTPKVELLPFSENMTVKEWQMYQEVLDILNEAISDNPANRPTPVELEQKLNQILISAAFTDPFASPGFQPDQATPVSEEHPILTAMVPGNGKAVIKR